MPFVAPRRSTEQRPPKDRHGPVFKTGLRVFGLGEQAVHTGGPGEPPPGFVSPTTSASEWVEYWALSKVFNDPRDPRVPPFFGGRDWGYQLDYQGGRHVPGGAVVDFVVYLPGEIVGIRLQTDRFHLTAGPVKNAYDDAQRQSLSRFMRIIDLYEGDVIRDTSGEGAVRLTVEALGGRERINPQRAGTFYRSRPNAA